MVWFLFISGEIPYECLQFDKESEDNSYSSGAF